MLLSLIPNPLIIMAGVGVGILVAAPVGPVNVICIQRAVERGFWAGVAAGLGAVIGDGLIALVAALGIGAISGAIKHYRTAIQIVGGAVLVLFGLRLYLAPPRPIEVQPVAKDGDSLGLYGWVIPQTFLLTVTNPGAVLGLFAIFGGVSTFLDIDTYYEAFTLVLSIIGGSLLWWVLLSHFIGRIRHRLTDYRMRQINLVSGLLLIAFGCVLLGELALQAARII